MQLTPIATLPSRWTARAAEVVPGTAVCLAVATVATVIGRLVPAVGAAVPALVFGVLIGLVRRPSDRLRPGIGYSSKFLLQLAIVLLGTQLTLGTVAEVGIGSLPVMLSTLAVCLIGTWALGKALGVGGPVRTLIGVGTGICGASAIAAVAPVIGAAAAETAYAVSTIFLFNVLAVIVFPVIGHAVGLDFHAFGLFAGTAVNDTSSVVAAATVFGAGAVGFAVVVKLVRTLMLIPITVVLAVRTRTRTDGAERLGAVGIIRLVPWFLVGFLLVTLVSTVLPPDDGARTAFGAISTFLVAMALAGIGLSTDVAGIRRAGWRPLLLGALLWALVTVTALAVIALLNPSLAG